MSSEAAPRIIAFHLPQFHPIPENNAWWGEGFTEWTNTGKAKPLFRGHRQPNVPTDLGYYDLRLPESRAAQANLAKAYGVDAFCYYHYWFGGRRLLQRPVEEMLASCEPDMPFCLCWANETWTGIWHGAPGRVLIEQTYPGEEDHRAHFAVLRRAFSDPRYLRVDGRPVFLIYRAWEIPDVRGVLALWSRLAGEAGLAAPYFISVRGANQDWDAQAVGFEATITPRLPPRDPHAHSRHPLRRFQRWWKTMRGLPTIHDYGRAVGEMLEEPPTGKIDLPCVIPNWDNTPRSGVRGLVLQGATPALFRPHLRRALEMAGRYAPPHRMVFVKSWNEWAEGNYLEPDLAFGRGYLEVVREEVARVRQQVPG